MSRHWAITESSNSCDSVTREFKEFTPMCTLIFNRDTESHHRITSESHRRITYLHLAIFATAPLLASRLLSRLLSPCLLLWVDTHESCGVATSSTQA